MPADCPCPCWKVRKPDSCLSLDCPQLTLDEALMMRAEGKLNISKYNPTEYLVRSQLRADGNRTSHTTLPHYPRSHTPANDNYFVWNIFCWDGCWWPAPAGDTDVASLGPGWCMDGANHQPPLS